MLATLDGEMATQPLGSSTAPGSGGAGTDSTDEVTPQRVPKRVAPVTKTKPTRRLHPGDRICGQCGEGNPPVRKFCSRCGEELSNAEVVRAKWWTRLLFWRRTRSLEAGTRPGQRGVKQGGGARAMRAYRRIRLVVGTVLMTFSLAYAAVGPFRGVVNRTVEPPLTSVTDSVKGWWTSITNGYDDLAVFSYGPSDALPEHQPDQLFDGSNSTYWAARWTKKDRPQVVFFFKDAEDLDAVVVHACNIPDDEPDLLRPKQLNFRAGSSNNETIDVANSPDPQTLKFDSLTTLRKVTLTVTDVYPQQGVRNVGICRIELKTRK